MKNTVTEFQTPFLHVSNTVKQGGQGIRGLSLFNVHFYVHNPQLLKFHSLLFSSALSVSDEL